MTCSSDQALAIERFYSAAYCRTCFELFFVLFDPTRPIIHRPTFHIAPDDDLRWLTLVMVLVGSFYNTTESGHQSINGLVLAQVRDAFDTTLRASSFNTGLCLFQAGTVLNYLESYWGDTLSRQKAMLSHASLCEHLRLNGYWQTRLESSSLMTWNQWAFHEQRKRLMCFVLILDTMFCTTFGGDIHVPFVKTVNSLPCDDQLWMATTEAQWWEMMVTRGGDVQEPMITAFDHITCGARMPSIITNTFSAAVLLVGATSAAPVKFLRIPSVIEDRSDKEVREKKSVIVWGWQHAFKTKFGTGTDNGGDYEILYHLAQIHHVNANSLMMRIAAGETRVGSISVKPWQRRLAYSTAASLAGTAAGSFATWHSMQIFQVRM